MGCVLILVGLLACSAKPVSPARRDNERDLLTRIARERNPVKKAKYEVRLARVKLFQAMEALDRKDVEGSQKLLRDYLERLKSAWATLQSSGRSAHRKPQGFKELDIELREDARYLEDLKHRFSYLDRGPVEKTAQEVEHLRSVVLKALFPPPQPRKP